MKPFVSYHKYIGGNTGGPSLKPWKYFGLIAVMILITIVAVYFINQ